MQRVFKMSCAICGTLLPAEARFCLACGAPQTSELAPDDEDPPSGSIASSDPAVCEIVLWHGYVKAEFVACVSDGEEMWEAARSPGFRCRAGTQPGEDDERAVAAFDRLLEVLADEGWEPVSGGRPWYAYRFRRRATRAHELPAALRPSLREASRAAVDPAP